MMMVNGFLDYLLDLCLDFTLLMMMRVQFMTVVDGLVHILLACVENRCHLGLNKMLKISQCECFELEEIRAKDTFKKHIDIYSITK